MAYTRIKTIKGRKYKYLVTGKREGDNVIQKVLKYLGPIEPVYKIGKSRKKTNATIYVRQLSDEETEKLKEATRTTSAFTKDRAKIILLSSKKLFAKQIADKVSCEERKVRNAIKAFNEKGLLALERGKAKGAKPKFTEITKKVMLLHFSKHPKDFGLHFTTWTLPRFRKHLIEDKIVDSISIEKVRQILDEAGARLKRSKRWQYSPDKELVKKKLQ